MRGGKREGSGRKKGSLTKKTQEIIAAAAGKGITPLEYMLEVLRDPTASESRRDWAAGAAAPYLHSRMPQALVPAAPPGPHTAAPEDKQIIDLYLRGVHEEANGN
jgi:hypothetical protein